jgi:hypothetical protein
MSDVEGLMLMGADVDAGGDGKMPECRMEESRVGGGGAAAAAPEGDDDGNCGESDVEDGIVLK